MHLVIHPSTPRPARAGLSALLLAALLAALALLTSLSPLVELLAFPPTSLLASIAACLLDRIATT